MTTNRASRTYSIAAIIALPWLLLLGFILATSAVTYGGYGENTDMQQFTAMVNEQAADLGCSSQTPALTEVAVRDAKGFDNGVVRKVSFKQAWDQAHAGKVIVVGYCKK